MTPFLTFLYPTISAIVAAFLGWFFTRKKQKAEVVKSEMDIVEQAVGIWRKLAEDLNEDLKGARSEIAKVQEQLAILIEENKGLREEIQKLEKDVERLSSENRKLHTLIKQRK